MKLLIAAAFLLSTNVLAQTETFQITTQSCATGMTRCSLIDESGNQWDLQGNPWVIGASTLLNAGTDADGLPFDAACQSTSTLLYATNYRRSSDVVITCDNGVVFEAIYSNVRSGSGRGGWAWHNYLYFATVTTP
jgi:hypothetical protein